MAYSCTIDWTAVTGATAYKVYRGEDPGTSEQDASPVNVGDVTTYEYTVEGAGTWYFSVSAIVGGVEGELSQEVAIESEQSGTPPVGRPVLSVE